MKALKSNRVQDWTKKDIQTWLSLNGLSDYYTDFVECGITDGSLLKNKLDGISSEQDLKNWVSNFVFAFGHLRKLYSAVNHLKDNAFVFNIESVNFETERQQNDTLSGKSSSFVSKATVIDSGMVNNRDVRILTVHEVVSLIRNDSRILKLKDENLGIGAWSKEHEETFLSHKIDGQIFINITKPSDYADFVFDKLRPVYSDALRAELFETLTKIANEIYGNGYRYVDPVDRSSTTVSDIISEQSSDSSYPLLSHQEQLGVIIGKIRQSSKKVQNMSDDDLKEYAENLCTVDGLKKAYLNKEFNAIKKLFSSMRNISQQSKGFSLNSKSESKSLIGMTDSASLDKLPSDIEEAEELSKKLATRFKDTIKVKLVIAEIAKNKKERTMRRLLSPIMSSVSMSPQFGLFHSGVIIGPWLIEWNSSSLCIPRRCYSNAATLAIDIQEISTKSLDVAIEKVSQVISEWNVHRAYSQHSSNCQHFVDDICKALGIKMTFSGSMQHYVEKLRTKGLCNIRWRVPDDIRELVGIKEKKITFYTHKQLDILVCTILSKIPDFQEKYEEDYMLLKSFDRAFWLRSFKSPQNANYHAITPEENRKYSGLKSEDDDDMGVFGDCDDEGDGNGDGTGCPFGHPESRSFTADWW